MIQPLNGTNPVTLLSYQHQRLPNGMLVGSGEENCGAVASPSSVDITNPHDLDIPEITEIPV